MREDHPVDHLVFVVEGPASASVAALIEQLVRELCDRRSWTIRPPELVDELHSYGRSVGLALSIYSALPPWRAELDPAVDRAHVEEAKELAGEICRISDEHGVSFDVELAGEQIGSVESGQMDHSLKVGLFAEWERMLNS